MGVWCELRREDVGGDFNVVVVEFVCRGCSVIVVARAKIMHVAEVGYSAACMDVSWVVRRSRTSLTVL